MRPLRSYKVSPGYEQVVLDVNRLLSRTSSVCFDTTLMVKEIRENDSFGVQQNYKNIQSDIAEANQFMDQIIKGLS